MQQYATGPQATTTGYQAPQSPPTVAQQPQLGQPAQMAQGPSLAQPLAQPTPQQAPSPAGMPAPQAPAPPSAVQAATAPAVTAQPAPAAPSAPPVTIPFTAPPSAAPQQQAVQAPEPAAPQPMAQQPATYQQAMTQPLSAPLTAAAPSAQAPSFTAPPEASTTGPLTSLPPPPPPDQVPSHSGLTAGGALSKLTGAVRGRRAARKPRLAMSAIFADLVDMADIPRSAYSVDEEITGAMCLFKTDGGYEVFSCAEDARHEVRFFEEEEAAYFYLFGVLAAEALRNGRLGPRRS
jgi:hypothetical protein